MAKSNFKSAWESYSAPTKFQTDWDAYGAKPSLFQRLASYGPALLEDLGAATELVTKPYEAAGALGEATGQGLVKALYGSAYKEPDAPREPHKILPWSSGTKVESLKDVPGAAGMAALGSIAGLSGIAGKVAPVGLSALGAKSLYDTASQEGIGALAERPFTTAMAALPIASMVAGRGRPSRAKPTPAQSPDDEIAGIKTVIDSLQKSIDDEVASGAKAFSKTSREQPLIIQKIKELSPEGIRLDATRYTSKKQIGKQHYGVKKIREEYSWIPKSLRNQKKSAYTIDELTTDLGYPSESVFLDDLMAAVKRPKLSAKDMAYDDLIRNNPKFAEANDEIKRLNQLIAEKSGQAGSPFDELAAGPEAQAGPTMLDRIFGLLKGQAGAAETGRLPGTEAAGRLATFAQSEPIVKGRQKFVDEYARVADLQKQPGVQTIEGANPYQATTLYPGRTGTRLEDVKTTVINLDKELLSTAKRIGVHDADLKKAVNDYLIAKHAPERNAALGEKAAGISTEQAAAKRAEIEGLPHGQEIAKIAAKVKALNDVTLDVLVDGQVITPELRNMLRQKYPEHVPLQRIMDNDNIEEILVGSRGFNVKGAGIQKAKGSEREIRDIFGNVTANLQSAIVRSEKNKVSLEVLGFARNNPELGIFREIQPKAIGVNWETAKQALAETNPEIKLAEILKGKAEGKTGKTPGTIFQQINDPQVITMREGGKPRYLKVEDPVLASVFQGVNKEHLPPLFRGVTAVTRLFSSLATRFNPEFAFSNIVRDSQELAIYLSAQKGIGTKGAGKGIYSVGRSLKDVSDSLRGIDSEGAKLYREMKTLGGTTGGMGLSTRKQVELDLAKIERTNRSVPRLAAQKLLGAVDHFNTVFEDATRLSAYKAARASGMTKKASAALAKDATINFNRKGTAGPVINSLYMFANASIQGQSKLLRSMKNPKVAATVLTGIGGAVYAVNNYNDGVDPAWRDKVSDWDRQSNMVVMLPSKDGGARYMKVPVSWGLKPIKALAEYSFDLAAGHEQDTVEAGKKIAAALFDANNPLGGTDFYSSITPTVGDLPLDLARNKAWYGSNIKPYFFDQNQPESMRFYPNTGESAKGQAAIGAAGKLSGVGIEVSPNDLIYAFDTLVGGTGRAGSRVLETLTSGASGELPEVRNMPVINRFMTERSPEETQRAAYSRELQRLKANKPKKQIFKYQR